MASNVKWEKLECELKCECFLCFFLLFSLLSCVDMNSNVSTNNVEREFEGEKIARKIFLLDFNDENEKKIN